MRKAISTLALAAIAAAAAAQTGDLPRVAPEDEGIPSQAVAELLDSLTSLPLTETHSVVIARHGKIVAEIYPDPIKPQYKHTMYSCSKTFVAAGVGLAIADGLLDLSDRVVTFFPESAPQQVSPELDAMTVEHLLTMTSGIEPDWNLRGLTPHWTAAMLAKKAGQPGATFQYDSMCSYLLSAIVQKVTGTTLLEYLKAKLFNPMNITDVQWEYSPEGCSTGGWGLYIQPESLAKFGILLTSQGRWNGQQLIPAEWVELMTTPKVRTNTLDYCYHTWAAEYPRSFRADGALGQYILMEPESQIVVVITECTLGNGVRQRELVWETLMPQLSDTPLPHSASTAELRAKQTTYSLPTPKGQRQNPEAESEAAGKTYRLDDNRLGWTAISICPADSALQVSLTTADGVTTQLACGFERWITTATTAYPPYSISAIGKFNGIDRDFHMAASYAWSDTGQLTLRIQYADWVSAVTASLDFHDSQVSISAIENYSRSSATIKGLAQ